MERQPTGEADEGEGVAAIVEEVDRKDRHARDDKENLDAEDDEDADEKDDDDTSEPTSWNRCSEAMVIEVAEAIQGFKIKQGSVHCGV
ncbi:hypothetical protein E2562_008191 [Oryza meyeriana var. granulata]|uniref:Uncharacterized protein n=1 Tax=Oryza meyeriana var. granulata TaxID=110450 RepID=A0A6G1CDP3_9ORYZ|nr:hypothetical protein E2562_008191 [Oryza meyeriana var. granulata]